MSPCILTNITPSMRVYSEEIFGPVALIIPFDTDEVFRHNLNPKMLMQEFRRRWESQTTHNLAWPQESSQSSLRQIIAQLKLSKIQRSEQSTQFRRFFGVRNGLHQHVQRHWSGDPIWRLVRQRFITTRSSQSKKPAVSYLNKTPPRRRFWQNFKISNLCLKWILDTLLSKNFLLDRVKKFLLHF